ncbi:UNVERIFIED_CONTAM: hypothetical protein H355_003233 [Colinus virginianus]|nr:hypothetical protein H355_003233 [Colinus virginianus]
MSNMAETNSAAKEPSAQLLPKLVMKGVDMSQEEVQFATQVARKGFVALQKSEVRYWQDVAQMLKNEFEQRYKGMWHVIVGQHFGAFVTHEAHHMIYFTIGHVSFLIYKHG